MAYIASSMVRDIHLVSVSMAIEVMAQTGKTDVKPLEF
jgi:hypothetical protein